MGIFKDLFAARKQKKEVEAFADKVVDCNKEHAKKYDHPPFVLPKKKEIIDVVATQFPRTELNVRPIVKNDFGHFVVAQDSCDENAPIPFKIYHNRSVDEIPPELTDHFVGWQILARLVQNVYIDRIVSTPAIDAMACGFRLTQSGLNQNLDEFRLTDLKNEALERYNVDNICEQGIRNKRLFGGALIVPDFDGVDMSLPYNPRAIRRNSFRGVANVEPLWVSPQFDLASATMPGSARFYKPTWYFIQGRGRIHHTWCEKLTQTEAPDILKPTYYYWGISLAQQVRHRCESLVRNMNEASLLISSKRLNVIDANVQAVKMNEAEAVAGIEQFAYFRDNYGVLVKDPANQFYQYDTSLANLAELIMLDAQLLAAESQITLTKLLKTTPKGFNSTGENEEADYKSLLMTLQNGDCKRIIKRTVEWMCLSEYGEDYSLCVDFNPNDTPSQLDMAKIRELNSLTDVHYTAAGVLSNEEVRRRIVNDPSSGYSTIDVEDVPFENTGQNTQQVEVDNKNRPVRNAEDK